MNPRIYQHHGHVGRGDEYEQYHGRGRRLARYEERPIQSCKGYESRLM